MGTLDAINKVARKTILPEIEKMVWSESPLLSYIRGYQWGRYKRLFRMAREWGYRGDLYR